MATKRDQELEREIRTHLELEAEELIAKGMSPGEAHQAARRSFGSVTRTREDVRAVWTQLWLEQLWRDLGHALRSLRRSPAFTAIAAAALGLGIAATVTVFSAVDAILVRPLAVAAPAELHVVGRVGETRARFPFELYQTVAESGRVFSGVLASFTFPLTVVESGTGTRASAAFVTRNYFDVLGLRPQRGRFQWEDAERGVVVISDQFWKQRFNGRASILGESVQVGRQAFVIVGVAPAGFQGLQLGQTIDLWLPMSATPEAIQIPAFRTRVDIVGRLAAGVSPAAATSQLSTDYEQWANEVAPASARVLTSPMVVLPASHGLESRVRDEFRASLALLVGTCACLWVITIVNVSGLLTARLRDRSREIGVRLALGVTSARLFVQLLAETAVLVGGGVLWGVLAAVLIVGGIPRWIPSWEGADLRLSPLVLAITVMMAVLTSVIVAVIQRVSIERRRLTSYLVPHAAPRRGQRLRLSAGLVSAQLALTLPLIVMASLLVQSFVNLGRVDTGFGRSNLVQIEVEPVLVGYSAERAIAYYAALLERLRALPGVSDATVSNGGALSGFDGRATLEQKGATQEVRSLAVGDRYFSTLDIRVLAGRAFEAGELHGDARVAIVNAALARRLFGGEARAVGQAVTLADGGSGDDRIVVGTVENTTDANLRDSATPTLYVPVGRSPLLVVHVRTASNSSASVETIRRAASSLDPEVPILEVATIDNRRQSVLQRERLLAAASSVVAWVALGLSAVGLLGLVSYAIAVRTREIGVRQALGAGRWQIARLFLADTAGTVVPGALLGIGIAAALARMVRGFLYGVPLTDVITYAGAACLLTAVAVAATLLPLQRALAVGPSANLRDD